MAISWRVAILRAMSLHMSSRIGEVVLPLKMDLSNPFVKSVFQVIDNSAPLSESITLLRQAEISSGVQLLKPPKSELPWLPDNQYEAVMEVNFYNFMSQTQLILNPPQYDELSLVLPGGVTWEATWRGWSATLAEWANRAEYCGFSRWDDADILNGLDYPVERHKEWSEMVLHIIEVKCREAENT